MKKVILTILIIILISLLGLIAYQYFNNDNEEEIIVDENVEINNGCYSVYQEIDDNNNKTITTINNTTPFVKIDKLNFLSDDDKKNRSLPFIYKIIPSYSPECYVKKINGKDTPIDYRQFRNEFKIIEEEQEGIISIPYLNLNIEGIEKINYMLKAICLNQNSIYDFDFCPQYRYMITIKDDILSIYINTFSYENGTTKTFNIDLKNKKILSVKEFYEKLNLQEKDVIKAIKEVVDTTVLKFEKEDSISNRQFAKKIYNDFIEELDNEELIYGYKIDLNKNLNDFAKYNFNVNITSKYACVINPESDMPDGTNNICIFNDSILLHKCFYDSTNKHYYKTQIKIK